MILSCCCGGYGYCYICCFDWEGFLDDFLVDEELSRMLDLAVFKVIVALSVRECAAAVV